MPKLEFCISLFSDCVLWFGHYDGKIQAETSKGNVSGQDNFIK